MNKFNIGDTVVISDTGQSYSTDSESAQSMGISGFINSRWADDHLENGVSKAKVANFIKDCRGYIYGLIDEAGSGWVFGEQGLTLSKRVYSPTTPAAPVTPDCRELVDYAKGIIQMDEELQALRDEVIELREWKRKILEVI